MKKKDKTIKSFIRNILLIIIMILVVVTIITIPIILEKLIDQEKVKYVSIFGKDVWFSFWASYLGAIGTVSLGIIALKQNKTLSKANQELDNIQKDYFDTMSKPTFKLAKIISIKYEKKETLEEDLLDNINTRFPIVFSPFRKNIDSEPCWHTSMIIPINSTSDIPLIDFRVDELEWDFNSEKFKFVNVFDQKYCKLPFQENNNLCTLNLIYPDMTSKTKQYQKCGMQMQLFIEASPQMQPKLRECRITMSIVIRNQLMKERRFSLEMELLKVNTYQLEIRKYFLMPID